MKEINKTYYWIFTLVLFTAVIGLKFFGYLALIDSKLLYVFIGVWICLILLPLFSEFEFFGIKLKKELIDFKKDVKNDILSIRNEVRNINNQQIYLNYDSPPSDKKIVELENEIERLKEKYQLENTEAIKPKSGIILPVGGLDFTFNIDNHITDLFSIRYTLENLIKEIWVKNVNNKDSDIRGILAPIRMLSDLSNIADKDIISITREIISICNYVVHGENVSKKQIDFVEKNSKLVYEYFMKFMNKE